jgi:hypothetical protein
MSLSLEELVIKINNTLKADQPPHDFIAKLYRMPDCDNPILVMSAISREVVVDYRTIRKDKDLFRVFDTIEAETPEDHIKEALRLSQSDYTPTHVLPSALAASILVNNTLTEEELKFIRSNNLNVLCRLAKIERSYKLSSGPGQRWNVRLLEELVKATDYPDKDVISSLSEGFPLTGLIPDGGAFEPSLKKTKVTRKPRLDKEHIEAVDRFLNNISEKQDDNTKNAFEVEVETEIVQGFADGPYNLSDLKSPPQFVSPRFPIVQGDKVRVIDHLSFREKGSKWGPSLNSSADVRHKVTMPRMGHIDEMLRRIENIEDYKMLKLDHQNAYKQLKIRESDRELATTAYRLGGKTMLTIPKALPFGSVGSVTAYLRVAMFHCFLIQTVMLGMILSYMDDFFACCKDTDWSWESTVVFNDLISGAILKNKKTALDKEVELLGLVLSIENGGVVLRMSESKRTNLIEGINQAIASGHLDKKLAGRLNFVVESMAGRTGRAISSVLVRHGGEVQMSIEVLMSLERMSTLLLKLHSSRQLGRPVKAAKTICVYTDAEGSGGAGIVIPTQRHTEGLFSAFTLSLGPSWARRATDIIPLELTAAVCGIATAACWCKLSTQDAIILYVDNSTAEVILGQGKSKMMDLNDVAGKLWSEIAAGLLPQVYLARVASKLNPADAPSRREFTKQHLDGLWVRPPIIPHYCDVVCRDVYI